MIAAEHLRGGKLCRADQAERDRQIADRYRAGETQDEIAAAFLISRVTVWSAVLHEGARISMTEVALRRERRKVAA